MAANISIGSSPPRSRRSPSIHRARNGCFSQPPSFIAPRTVGPRLPISPCRSPPMAALFIPSRASCWTGRSPHPLRDHDRKRAAQEHGWQVLVGADQQRAPFNQSTNTIRGPVFPAFHSIDLPVGIASVTPDRGSVEGDTLVVIKGQGFTPGAQATVGGVPSPHVVYLNSETLRIRTGPPCASSADGFRYRSPLSAPRANANRDTRCRSRRSRGISGSPLVAVSIMSSRFWMGAQSTGTIGSTTRGCRKATTR